MPLAFSDIWDAGNIRLLMWDIEEGANFFWHKLILPEAEARYVKTIKVERRMLQSLATRWLLQEQLGTEELAKLRRDEYGRPFLTDSPWHVSFSHTHLLSAIAIAPTKVGLDIQRFDPRIPVFARKRFASEEELRYLNEATSFEHLHVMWGLKEAMYKACGLRGVHFIHHMRSEPIVYQAQGGYINALVDMPGHDVQLYRAAYFTWQGHMVVMVSHKK